MAQVKQRMTHEQKKARAWERAEELKLTMRSGVRYDEYGPYIAVQSQREDHADHKIRVDPDHELGVTCDCEHFGYRWESDHVACVHIITVCMRMGKAKKQGTSALSRRIYRVVAL